MTLILARILLLNFIVGAAYAAPTSLWTDVQKIEHATQQLQNLRNKMEVLSYEVTLDLCYTYEFRHKKGLKPEVHGIFSYLKALSLESSEKNDERLQRSFDTWNVLHLYGMLSLFTMDNFNVQFFKELELTQGFYRATAECSERIGTDITELLKQDIRNDMIIGASSASALSLVGGFRIIQRILRSHWATVLVSKFPKTAKVTGLSLVGGLSVYTGVFIYDLRKASKENEVLAQELQENLALTENIETSGNQVMDDLDLWLVRRHRSYVFVRDFRAFINGLGTETEDFALETPERLKNELRYFYQNRVKFQAKAKELHGELSENPDPAQYVHSIRYKKTRDEALNKDEIEYLEEAKFFGALQFIDQILKQYEKHSLDTLK